MLRKEAKANFVRDRDGPGRKYVRVISAVVVCDHQSPFLAIGTEERFLLQYESETNYATIFFLDTFHVLLCPRAES